MDILSDILDLVSLRGSLYFKAHFSPPWAVEVPAFRHVARFHFVMRGDCWVDVAGAAAPLHLGTGDLVVIPHGAAHVLKDAPATVAATLDDVVEKSGFSGEGALVYGGEDAQSPCKLVCGHFEFDEDISHPLLSSLPPFLHVAAVDGLDYSWLDSALRFVAHEATGERPGSAAILRRLAEIVFVQTLRALDGEQHAAVPGIAGLMDHQLRSSLTAIHGRPGEPWTVESLAREAAMSRTRFSVRFKERVGMAPMEYLTLWRMQRARKLIATTNRPIVAIAQEVGYTSESAFGRAFTRWVGRAPGALRREAG
ncbi:MAG: AraC family transcriptional regulator [Pseudomonadota bacterium]